MDPVQHYAINVVTAAADASAAELARLMSDRAVGCVIVVDGSQPIGIVTDRDLLCRVVGRGLPATTRAADVMSKPLQVAGSEEPLNHLLDRMRATGVRRMPVVKDGALVGIVTTDDIMIWLTHELEDLSEAFRREIRSSRSAGRKRRRREDIEERLGEIREQVTKVGEEAWDFVGNEIEALRERFARALGRDKPD